MPKVSVVVPVYNIEDYLEKCVDSILTQSLKDIEIILIDDGSTDSSGEICDQYALLDNRVRVIHKSNEGLSCARNDGIDISTSPYIMFVDGDDWVEPEYCEKPYNMAITYSADLVLFTYQRVFSNGTAVRRETGLSEGMISEADAMRFNVCVSPAAMFSLYRKELFDDIKFPAGRYHEDYATTHKLIHKARRIFYVDSCLYHYWVRRPGSITTKKDQKSRTDKVEMILDRVTDLRDWGYDDYALKYVLSLLVRHGNEIKDYDQLEKYVKGLDIPVSFGRKEKFLLSVIKASPKLFDIICIAFGKRQRLDL